MTCQKKFGTNVKMGSISSLEGEKNVQGKMKNMHKLQPTGQKPKKDLTASYE